MVFMRTNIFKFIWEKVNVIAPGWVRCAVLGKADRRAPWRGSWGLPHSVWDELSVENSRQ